MPCRAGDPVVWLKPVAVPLPEQSPVRPGHRRRQHPGPCPTRSAWTWPWPRSAGFGSGAVYLCYRLNQW